VSKYINPKGERILAALDDVSKRTGAKNAEVALAWIAAQPGVGAAIASGTSVEQVESLAKGARLKLSEADLSLLTQAGA
jgi:aryl-alcohol dehydrogenase-like predicted oxidoreductase